MNLKSFILLSFLFFSFTTYCQIPITILSVDSLVGSNHAGRNWWDLQHYTIDIETDIDNKRLSGSVSIKYKVIGEWSCDDDRSSGSHADHKSYFQWQNNSF
jgi:hypothetical protein